MKMYYCYNKVEDNKHHIETHCSLGTFSVEANIPKYSSRSTSSATALEQSKITACKSAFIMILKNQQVKLWTVYSVKNQQKYKSL